MPRFDPPNLMRALDPDEPYEPSRTRMWRVPIWAEGIDARVGWDGRVQSYFFFCVRTSVAHLGGAFDHYLNKPVEAGDIYWAGGRWRDAPIEAEPDMREPILTAVDLINWTWDEFKWPEVDADTLANIRDARNYEQALHISDQDRRPRTDELFNWLNIALFNYPRVGEHM